MTIRRDTQDAVSDDDDTHTQSEKKRQRQKKKKKRIIQKIRFYLFMSEIYRFYHSLIIKILVICSEWKSLIYECKKKK